MLLGCGLPWGAHWREFTPLAAGGSVVDPETPSRLCVSFAPRFCLAWSLNFFPLCFGETVFIQLKNAAPPLFYPACPLLGGCGALGGSTN
jgi:hypothetical protein